MSAIDVETLAQWLDDSRPVDHSGAYSMLLLGWYSPSWGFLPCGGCNTARLSNSPLSVAVSMLKLGSCAAISF